MERLRQGSGQAFEQDNKSSSIERVLPENPGDSWSTFSDDQVDRCVYRLGNMTPLATRANRDLGNRSYVGKCAVYALSEFELTRRIALENDAWNPDRVATRQAWMATQATAIWRLSELDD